MPNKDTATPASRVVHVNAAPAQTWNYLRINDLALELGEPRATGEVFARLPRLFSGIETTLGADAVAWVESSAGDARYLEVRDDEADQPIYIGVDGNTGDVRDTGVMVREGASATIVMCASGGAAGCSSASLLRLVAERNAQVSIVEIVATADGHTHLDGVAVEAAEGAHVTVRQYALGGATSALGCAVNLAGAGARLELDCRYLARGTDQLDVSHVVRQRGRGTRANLVTSGVLADAARKTMRETIDLVRGAKDARGSEVESVLVTGDEVVNKTLPVILCDEEDVAGTHGASIGAVSDEQLAYLANRGIDREAAEALFVRALFDDAAMHAVVADAAASVVARARDVLGPDAATEVAEAAGVTAEVAEATGVPSDGRE